MIVSVPSCARGAEPVTGAFDADVAPHQTAQAALYVHQVKLRPRAGGDAVLKLQGKLRPAIGLGGAGGFGAGPGAKGKTLQQRIAGQAVGPVQAAATSLADGVKARKAGTAHDVAIDAADHVVRSRLNGN